MPVASNYQKVIGLWLQGFDFETFIELNGVVWKFVDFSTVLGLYCNKTILMAIAIVLPRLFLTAMNEYGSNKTEDHED